MIATPGAPSPACWATTRATRVLRFAGGAYVSVLGMIAGGLIGAWGLLVLVTVPLAVRNVRRVARSQPLQPQTIATLDVQTAQLHLAFGLLFALTILLGAVL